MIASRSEHFKIINNDKFQILVVDDTPLNRKIFETTLKKYFPNATIETANNGEEALKAVQQKSYRLIISDMQMERDNAGAIFLKAVRENEKRKQEQTPAIFIFCTTVPEIEFEKKILEQALEKSDYAGLISDKRLPKDQVQVLFKKQYNIDEEKKNKVNSINPSNSRTMHQEDEFSSQLPRAYSDDSNTDEGISNNRFIK